MSEGGSVLLLADAALCDVAVEVPRARTWRQLRDSRILGHMRRGLILTSLILAGIGVLGGLAIADALRSEGSSTQGTRAPTTTRLSTEEDVVTAPSVSSEEQMAEWEIAFIVNKWARLFGFGRRCNEYMTQPACERIDCARGFKTKNCTPLSVKVQRSFANATAQDIAIKGDFAGVRLSNGETVEFSIEAGWISKVGGNAGRRFFE
jgi:hypothetical protein